MFNRERFIVPPSQKDNRRIMAAGQENKSRISVSKTSLRNENYLENPTVVHEEKTNYIPIRQEKEAKILSPEAPVSEIKSEKKDVPPSSWIDDLKIDMAIEFFNFSDRLVRQYSVDVRRAITQIALAYDARAKTNLDIEPKIFKIRESAKLKSEDVEKIEVFWEKLKDRLLFFEKIFLRFGESLKVEWIRNEKVRMNVEDLGLLSESLVKRLVQAGIKIKIGPNDILNLSNEEFFRVTAPRGHAQENWASITGCWDSVKKIAYAGTGNHGSENAVLHEIGHGVGDLLGLDYSPALVGAHKRLYSRLIPYEQQGGPGALAGRQEFLAESFDKFHKLKKEKFILAYDEEWHTFLSNRVQS